MEHKTKNTDIETWNLIIAKMDSMDFWNGKLVSQFQEDDEEYQFQLERPRECQLIKEGIDVEKIRAAAEKERIEMEKQKMDEKE